MDSPRLSAKARAMVRDPDNEKTFSVASLWEIAIKSRLGRADFSVDPEELRAGLLANGYAELGIDAAHVIFTTRLPAINKDPFDRMLVAQALVEGLTLMTGDVTVATYSPAVMRV